MSNLDENNQNKLVVPEGTITLQGFTRFAFTAQKEGRIITDGYSMNFLKCTAELMFNDKHTFMLHTKEFIPDSPIMYRELTFNGVMTLNGLLKYSWPETWSELGGEGKLQEKKDILAQVRRHTGMAIFGEGINNNTLNFMGYFDGNKIFAHTHMVGLHKEPGEMDIFKTLMDGPIMINFMLDLEVYNKS
jgi:hypothetical protein